MSMYIWEVALEVEWKYVVKNGKTSKTHTDVESREDFTVAAPSGLQAIERAKRVALDKERGYVDDWSSENEITTATPTKVLDVVGLKLKEALDG